MAAEVPHERQGALGLLQLETSALTAAFWGSVLLFTLAFYVTPYLPLIDYQQHVALAAIMHRMLFHPDAPEHALYQVNLITYNGGFHLIVALLSYLLTSENAGRVVMSTYPLLFGLAALAIVREARRPRWYAFLALPITYSHGMAWGFANWNLTFPIAILGFTWWLRYAQGERRMLVRLLLASCFCAYGHVLAMLCMCLSIGVAQLSRLRSLAPTWPRRWARLAITPLPVMPGIAWCIFVYRYQTSSSFSNWAEASMDGLDDPLWYKIRSIFTMSVGNFYDLSDNFILFLALLIAAYLLFCGPPEPCLAQGQDDARLNLRAMRWLAVTFVGCYLIVPKVFLATWFIYERFPPLALLFLTGALPLRLAPECTELRAAAASLALAAGANTVRVWATMGEAADASAIINAIPAHRKLVAVTYEPATERISREVLVHLPALYQMRKPGEIAYTFTKFESMPVHYKQGKAPPSVPPGFEWDATKYNVHDAWARAYDLTLVHAPPEVEDVAHLVFRDEAWRTQLLARQGRFWLYDTSRLAESSPTMPLYTIPPIPLTIRINAAYPYVCGRGLQSKKLKWS